MRRLWNACLWGLTSKKAKSSENKSHRYCYHMIKLSCTQEKYKSWLSKENHNLAYIRVKKKFYINYTSFLAKKNVLLFLPPVYLVQASGHSKTWVFGIWAEEESQRQNRLFCLFWLLFCRLSEYSNNVLSMWSKLI